MTWLIREGYFSGTRRGRRPISVFLSHARLLWRLSLNALAAGPLTEKELLASVRKKLPGYQGMDLKEHLSYSKQVYEYPKYGKVKIRYGLQPPEPGPYLGKTVQDITAIQSLLAPSGSP